MASDQPPSMGASSNGSISLGGDDDTLLRGWWDKLSDGAQVTMPLNQAPWGDYFGQLTDKFGIPWMINISGTASASQPVIGPCPLPVCTLT